jgi:hypothetical protein
MLWPWPSHTAGPPDRPTLRDPLTVPHCGTTWPSHTAGPPDRPTLRDHLTVPHCGTPWPSHTAGPPGRPTLRDPLAVWQVSEGIHFLSPFNLFPHKLSGPQAIYDTYISLSVLRICSMCDLCIPCVVLFLQALVQKFFFCRLSTSFLKDCVRFARCLWYLNQHVCIERVL